MRASNIDKSGKVHKGKYVKGGECVFPYRYKNKLQNSCVDTGKGPWCATSTKKRDAINTWGYCVNPSVEKGAKALMGLKNARNKSASEALLMMSNKQKRTNKRSNKRRHNKRTNRRSSKRNHSNRKNKRRN